MKARNPPASTATKLSTPHTILQVFLTFNNFPRKLNDEAEDYITGKRSCRKGTGAVSYAGHDQDGSSAEEEDGAD
jgi:hypothetical protein